MRKSSTLIDGIIRNLRDFSADAPSQGTALFDVNTAIRRAVDLVAAYIRRATDRFSMDLHPACPATRGSLQGLQQVFINLLLNSCQSLGGRDRAIAVCSGPGDTSATLRVIVSDEGAGMPAEILSRVREAVFHHAREQAGAAASGCTCPRPSSRRTGERWSWSRRKGSAPTRWSPFPWRRTS